MKEHAIALTEQIQGAQRVFPQKHDNFLLAFMDDD